MSTKIVEQTKKRIFETHNLVKISLLSAVALALMMLDFALPIFPVFLQLDLSDVPAIIGAFAMGPLAGIMIELIKNILHGLIATSTMGIGEVANFIFGVAYIIPLGLIYKRNKSTKSVIIGVVAGTISMIIAACIFNYFILIPLYSAVVYGQPIDVFVNMANKVNGMVTNFATLILFAVAPFNLLKGIIMSIVGYLLYKTLKPILHKF